MPLQQLVVDPRGSGDQRWLLEAIPNRVVATYGLRPPTLPHYTAAPATEQKVNALAGRAETQARDVFDLDLLFPRPSRRRREGRARIEDAERRG